MSVTVIVQVLAPLTTTGLMQLTTVVVVCSVTVSDAVPELVAWVESVS